MDSKQELMFNHVEMWQRSSLTQAEYCRQNSISKKSFYYWLKKHRTLSKLKHTDVFVKLQPEPVVFTGSDITIVYPNGVRLEVNSTINSSYLKSLINILQNV